MGMLIDGVWSNEDLIIENGVYIRPKSGFSAEPESGFGKSAVAGRYHLIASASCPWSHRAVSARAVKRLERIITLHLTGGARVEGYPADFGRPWRVPGSDRTIVHLHELYTMARGDFTGRVTVPVLWDSVTQTIVSNESAAIMRALDMIDVEEGRDFTLVPPDLHGAIDELNRTVYENLSNAVYRAGFAARQSAYDEAVAEVFSTLDVLEDRLATRRFLHGQVMTESDLRLLPTLLRFDAVYVPLFRCTRRRLADYPNLWAYARDLFAWPGIAETVDFDAIRTGAFQNDRTNNPTGIVAVAPDIDWRAPHGRSALGAAQLWRRDGELVPASMIYAEPWA